MTKVYVRTQEELDEALANEGHEIVICSPKSAWLNISDSHGKDVEVSGDAMVEVSGDAMVKAFGNATIMAWGRAYVDAFGNATVIALDLATVRAWDTSTVKAWDNSTVNACENSTVRAWDNATVKAGICVAVYVHSKTVTHQGGVIIDMTTINAKDPETWCAIHLVEVDEDGQAHLYKALDADLNAGHDYRLTQYPIGHVVDDTANWVDNNRCGGGLHVSPTPWMANSYYEEASRFVEVCCPVEELRPIDKAKAKAPRLRVLREVTLDGSPIGGETR